MSKKTVIEILIKRIEDSFDSSRGCHISVEEYEQVCRAIEDAKRDCLYPMTIKDRYEDDKNE